jgi:hypothetical protein
MPADSDEHCSFVARSQEKTPSENKEKSQHSSVPPERCSERKNFLVSVKFIGSDKIYALELEQNATIQDLYHAVWKYNSHNKGLLVYNARLLSKPKLKLSDVDIQTNSIVKFVECSSINDIIDVDEENKN